MPNCANGSKALILFQFYLNTLSEFYEKKDHFSENVV